MYSDRIASSAAGSRKRSIKDRLGTVQNGDESFRENHNKRFQGYDGKWQHDMYDGACNNQLSRKGEQFGSQDLRSKLKRPVSRNVPGENNLSGGIKDLREKLSGPTVPPQPHPQVVSLPMKHSSAEKAVPPTVTTTPVSKPSAATKPPAGPKSSIGAGEVMTIASFLQSLGLSKYLTTFQAEEIDMSILRVMKDDELKELGIPMGPRKKINLALASQSKAK